MRVERGAEGVHEEPELLVIIHFGEIFQDALAALPDFLAGVASRFAHGFHKGHLVGQRAFEIFVPVLGGDGEGDAFHVDGDLKERVGDVISIGKDLNSVIVRGPDVGHEDALVEICNEVPAVVPEGRQHSQSLGVDLRHLVGKKENARRIQGVDEIGQRVDVYLGSRAVMLKVLLHGEDHHPGKMLAFQLVDLRHL